MSKLDEIFDDYKSIAGWVNNLSTDPERHRDEAWLKQQIKELMLELIGDIDVSKHEVVSVVELRQKVEAL